MSKQNIENKDLPLPAAYKNEEYYHFETKYGFVLARPSSILDIYFLDDDYIEIEFLVSRSVVVLYNDTNLSLLLKYREYEKTIGEN